MRIQQRRTLGNVRAGQLIARARPPVSDTRLGKPDDDAKADEDGGLQQQRHPGLGEEPAKKPEPPKQLDLLGLDSDDTDTIADKHAMDRAGATGTLIRAHAINQGRSADMLPDF